MKTIGDKPKLINDMTLQYTYVCYFKGLKLA